MKSLPFIIGILLCLAGCFDHARSVPAVVGHPAAAASSGIGDTLQAFGSWGLWVGAIGITISTLALIGSVFVAQLAGLRSILVDALILSGALILVSATIDYLGEHPWLVAVIVGIVGVILLLRYRPVIEKDLGIDQPVTPVAIVPAPIAAPSVVLPTAVKGT